MAFYILRRRGQCYGLLESVGKKRRQGGWVDSLTRRLVALLGHGISVIT